MAFSLTFKCACGYSSVHLQNAQNHANETGHIVNVAGTMSPNENASQVVRATQQQRERLAESLILQEAARRQLAVQKPPQRPDLPPPAPKDPQTFDGLLADLTGMGIERLHDAPLEKVFETWKSAGHLAHNILQDRQIGREL